MSNQTYFINNTSTMYQAASDKRFKKNIKTIEKPLDKLMNIKGVTFNWKVDEFPDRNFTNNNQIGVIAQDVEKVLPELVLTDDKGYKMVQYDKLNAVLIEAIKEQQEQIKNLTNLVLSLQK